MDKKETLAMNWRVMPRPQLRSRSKSSYQTTRRILEVILCLLAIPIVVPLGIAIAILILLDSPGPVLFLQDRVGKDGKVFKIIKFRTMHHNIDDSSHREYMKRYVSGQITNNNHSKKVFKPFSSSQVTPLGRLLRKTSLDELPQLINVLRNEMSFVGPRPNVTWEVEAYSEWHSERLAVLPGITGLAQIRGRSQITFDEIVRHDLEYIDNQCLGLDFKILWWTVASVLFRAGAE